MNSKLSGRCLIPIMILMFFTVRLAPVYPQGVELTEEIFFQPIETVITAGRTEQSIERAPATVAVISSDEIKASGALTVPELLRLVPGLDVVTVTASHSEVNARGLNQILSNKMLVLIDGRSVYLDFFGGIIWQGLPIVLDQIDRIEIVRSPSSALYGANAFSGVVNIITKTPRQLHGSHIVVQGGQNSSLNTSFVAGNWKGNTGYRVALGTRQINSYDDAEKESERHVLGNILVEHRFDNDAKLSLEAGLIDGSIVQIVRLDQNKFDATTTYAKMNLDHDSWKLQAFWNRGSETGQAFFPPGPDVDILYNTFDLEAQQKLDLGMNNTFIYGTSYRFCTIESSIIDKAHEQNLFAGYFQDEYRPLPELSFLAGGRIDYHPLAGVNFSPRGSMIYAPDGSHTFRISVGQAFRNPSFTDSYIQVETNDIPGFDFGVKINGQPDLESEKITTYEFGYTYYPSHRFRWEVDVFTYNFNDYIGPGAVQYPGGLPVQSFVNLGSARAYGFELSADIVPVHWMKLSSNYSYQDMDNNYTVLKQQSSPYHKANFKTFISLPCCLSASFLASYVGKTIWEVPTEDGGYGVSETEAHTRCDAKLSFLYKKRNLDVFIAAYNVFNNRQREYPLAEAIKRRVTAGFNWSF
ncbi:TonB-dependent receptor plug domain-containing protein [Gemmatimonadota bacterium]